MSLNINESSSSTSLPFGICGTYINGKIEKVKKKKKNPEIFYFTSTGIIFKT